MSPARMPCKLLALPATVLHKLGEEVVGEVDPTGLRGSSVIAREIAQLALVSKGCLTLVEGAWLCLNRQMPQILAQLGIEEVLKKYGWLHLLGAAPVFGPINLRNTWAPVPQKHSPGLQAMGFLEKVSLQEQLWRPKSPMASALPATSGLERAAAPPAVKMAVLAEKCQQFWRTPSPIWTNISANGSRPLNEVDMVRELLSDRPDRGLKHDIQLSSLLDSHIQSPWPYADFGSNTWWGFRKLVCDHFSAADIRLKHQQRRKEARICLRCNDNTDGSCNEYWCPSCCRSAGHSCRQRFSPRKILKLGIRGLRDPAKQKLKDALSML